MTDRNSIEETEDEDICGLCGEPGADKLPHPCYWPTERRPDVHLVHATCESEECERAFQEFQNQIGEEGIRELLRHD